MSLNILEMKPGILVTESVSLQGGIQYQREEEDSYFEEKSQIRKWKTTSIIEDIEERDEALRTRAKIYKLIRNKCIKTPVGLVCEKEKEKELEETLALIKEEKDKFNNKAKTCRLNTHYAYFEIKSDNYRVLSSILDQMIGVADQVNKILTIDDEATIQAASNRWLNGISKKTVLLLPEKEREAIVARVRAELIRKAIVEARGIERVLPSELKTEAKEIVLKSKRIAKTLTKRVEKHSESLNEVLAEVGDFGIKKNRMALVLAMSQAEEKKEELSQLKLAPPRKLKSEPNQLSLAID